ncbi:hypothetical protein [Vacuolonema iberomarrocanum]|uniref:hypothetical protein n=1 Tax=Vacuolonema iberomarrocanum TaxID=3454632 RepID=UPI0019E1E0B2|nr:hypothetical protein [filamentous cyanobacterium LEGE 07170]
MLPDQQLRGVRDGEVWHFLMAMRAKPVDITVANMSKEWFRAAWTVIHNSYQRSDFKERDLRSLPKKVGVHWAIANLGEPSTWGGDRRSWEKYVISITNGFIEHALNRKSSIFENQFVIN